MSIKDIFKTSNECAKEKRTRIEAQALAEQQFQRPMLESIALQNNAVSQSVSGLGIGGSSLLGNPYLSRQQFPQASPPNPNDIPAYSMSVKDLLTMFEAKANDKWLSRESLMTDEFWNHGVKRLQQYNLIETSFDGYWMRAREAV